MNKFFINLKINNFFNKILFIFIYKNPFFIYIPFEIYYLLQVVICYKQPWPLSPQEASKQE